MLTNKKSRFQRTTIDKLDHLINKAQCFKVPCLKQLQWIYRQRQLKRVKPGDESTRAVFKCQWETACACSLSLSSQPHNETQRNGLQILTNTNRTWATCPPDPRCEISLGTLSSELRPASWRRPHPQPVEPRLPSMGLYFYSRNRRSFSCWLLLLLLLLQRHWHWQQWTTTDHIAADIASVTWQLTARLFIFHFRFTQAVLYTIIQCCTEASTAITTDTEFCYN